MKKDNGKNTGRVKNQCDVNSLRQGKNFFLKSDLRGQKKGGI